MTEVLVHLALSLSLLVVYTVLTLAGHDATTILGVLAGQLGGAGVTSVVKKVENAGSLT